jgi:hypothetical protein
VNYGQGLSRGASRRQWSVATVAICEAFLAKKITGTDATAINFAPRYDSAPPEEWKPHLSSGMCELLYNIEKRKKSKTVKAMRKVAKRNKKNGVQRKGSRSLLKST